MRETARRIGISPSYLLALEHGRNPTTGRAPMPSPPILASIGQVLGIDLQALVRVAGAPPSRSAHLLLYQTGSVSRAKTVEGAGRAFAGRIEHWVDVGRVHAGAPGRALAGAVAPLAGAEARIGLIFAASSDPLGSAASPEAVLASETTWEDDVAAACRAVSGHAPAANVCVYREDDVRALTRVDPLTTAVSLIQSHPHVAVQDAAGAVSAGPAAVEAILAGLRPAGAGPAAWAALAAAAGAGFGRGPAIAPVR